MGRGIAPRGAAGEWETPPGKVSAVLPAHTLYKMQPLGLSPYYQYGERMVNAA